MVGNIILKDNVGLLPFFFLLGTYVVTVSPHLRKAPEAWTSVILKVLPIWYLAIYLLYVIFKSSRGYSSKEQSNISERNGNNNGLMDRVYKESNTRSRIAPNNFHGKAQEVKGADGLSRKSLHVATEESPTCQKRFLVGLLISSVGDACLVYNSLFKLGILAFGIAHVMYLLALKHRHKCSRLAWLAVPLCITLNLILVPGIDELIMNFMVLAYSILIHVMLFYAIAAFESFPSQKSLSTMIGASLFIASDFLIALNKWVTQTPYSEASILSTYYAAQFLLTLGVC